MRNKITIYTTEWCPDCRNAKRFLQHRGIPFEEIDIETTDGAALQVMQWSGGRRVVPTFVVHRESETPLILHNPSLQTLEELLADETEGRTSTGDDGS